MSSILPVELAKGQPMNGRERFSAIMSYQSYDRLPVWYFGTWAETKIRWKNEGLSDINKIPSETGMDPDWENGMWGAFGLVHPKPISGKTRETIEDTDEYTIYRTDLGAVLKSPKGGSSIPQHVEQALKPNRQSWNAFKKYLDPNHPDRRPADWEKKAAMVNNRSEVTAFMAGSLYGWPRDWMGVEELSCLFYDDEALAEEIVDTLTNFFMEIYRPVLQKVSFDFAYIHEDCCFNSGPLFSPDIYKKMYDKYYRKLIGFYRENGVKFILLDSDGMIESMIPHWLESGVDIFFPIEIGAWKADPLLLRKKFGKGFRVMGGVDKHIIPQGEAVIRTQLERLKPMVMEGGFIPLPDHRIPPNCSLEQFRTYVRIFKEVFNEGE